MTPYILFGKGVKPLSVFKSRRANKSNQVYFMHLLTFMTFNVKSSLFDAIGRLNTTERQ